MTEYKKYPEYKDSGVEWLGEIPADWNLQQLKKNTSLVSKKEDIPSFTLAMENIQSWTGNILGSFSKEYETSGIHFIENDILFGKLRPYLAKVWRADREGSAVGDFYVLRGNEKYFSPYLRYLLVSSKFIDIINSSTYGAKMPRVGWSFMGNTQVPVPDFNAQKKIVSFLDAETKKIDNSVASMESLISLLTEKRSALIYEIVTRSIPGEHTEFKDSGVEWLGEIPVGWEVRQAKAMMIIIAGQSPEGETVNTDGKGVPFIQGSAEFGKRFVKTDKFTTSPKKFADSGDLIISVRAPVGDLNYAPFKLSIGRGVAAIKTVTSLTDLDYLSYALGAYKPNFDAVTKGSTFQAITMSNLGSIKLPLPSLIEQKSISEFLNIETQKIDAIINEVRKSISLLKEKRQTLISDAVTGKIDVRDIVN